MQLKPQEQFAVVRQLSDPFDTGTYYVQAKIRNAHDDTLLATLNLSDKGNQRFRSDWQVPADPSGEGFYIDIETIVYTNSGYSTVSDVYGRENAVYLVQERQVPPFGGGGADVSYEKIGQTVRSAIKADREDQEPREKPEKVDLAGTEKRLIAAISGLREAVEGIDVPDHTPELKRLREASTEAKDAILAAIEAKPVTEETDLTPVLDRIGEVETTLTGKVADAFTRMAKGFTGEIDTLREVATKLVNAFNGTLFMVAGPRPKDEKIEMPEPQRPERKRRVPGASAGFVSVAVLALVGALLVTGAVGYSVLSQPQTAGDPTATPLGDTVNTLPQFTSTTSPSSAITQRTFGKDIRLTGYESLTCLGTDSNGMLQLGTCSGGGGGGSGSVGTSTPDVDTYVTYFTSNSATPALIGAESTFTYDDATNRLTVTNASTTAFSSGYASSTSLVGGTLTVNTSLTLGGDTLTELCGTGITCTSNTLAASLGTSITVGELASADFGDWTCNGAACTVDADSITLATDTTGNYIATLSSSGSITVGNSGSENAAATVNLNMGNANTWTALQTFTNSSTTLASFSYASSTVWRGGGLVTDCDSDAQALGWDLTTGQFVCGDDDSGVGGGITTIKEDDSDVVVAATAIDFGAGFDVAAVVTEGNVSLDLVEYNGAASTTLLSANTAWFNTFNATGTAGVATSTIIGDLQIGSSIGDNKVRITADRVFSASNSVGGLLNLTNTTNTGPALVVYTNQASSAGNLANFRCDNATMAHDCVKIDYDGTGDGLAIAATAAASNALSLSNTGVDHTLNVAYTGSTAQKGALNLTSTNTGGSVFQIAGNPTALGVGKITHNAVGDADSSILSLAASDTGYLGQGLFLDMETQGGTQKLLNIRADGDEHLNVLADGRLTVGTSTPTALAEVTVAATSTATQFLLSLLDDTRTEVLQVTDEGQVTIAAALVLADNQWVGLGASGARIEFDDLTTDEINVLSANLGVATSTPWGKFAVTGADTSTTNALIVANSADTPLLRVQNNGTTTISGITAATSTVYGFSTAAGKGATIILEDTDGAGCTEVYALNGVLTAATVTCPAEN